MNYLDTLPKLIEDSKREFEDSVRRRANGIDLGDVLEKLEGKTPAERNDSGWFIFYIKPYEIHVSNEKINLFGYENLVDVEFKGEEVESLYDKLVEDYAKNQKKQFHFS